MSEEIAVIEKEALSWPEKASAIRIVDQSTYDGAGQTLLAVAGLQKQIKEYHAPLKEKAFAAHKAIVAAEKRLLDPLDQASGIIRRQIGAWTEEQERIRKEEERRLAEEARKREEEARLQLAVEAEEAGMQEAAAEILETPLPVMAPVAAPTYAKVSGVSTQERWSARVDNLRELCKAIAAGTQPENLVQPNLPALNSMARAAKSNLRIPGVSPVRETTVAARAR